MREQLGTRPECPKWYNWGQVSNKNNLNMNNYKKHLI